MLLRGVCGTCHYAYLCVTRDEARGRRGAGRCSRQGGSSGAGPLGDTACSPQPAEPPFDMQEMFERVDWLFDNGGHQEKLEAFRILMSSKEKHPPVGWVGSNCNLQFCNDYVVSGVASQWALRHVPPSGLKLFWKIKQIALED